MGHDIFHEYMLDYLHIQDLLCTLGDNLVDFQYNCLNKSMTACHRYHDTQNMDRMAMANMDLCILVQPEEEKVLCFKKKEKLLIPEKSVHFQEN